METEQAFQIIQNVINGAVQKGLFARVDDVPAAAVALKTIEQAIIPKELKEGK